MSDAQNRNCLDAETLAAWVDGGLSGEALVRARTHVADCARCQAIVAVMVRIEAAVAAPVVERPARRWLGWLVPLAAAATAVAVWVAVPGTPILPLSQAVKEEAAPVAQSDPTRAAADLKAQAAPPQAPAEGRRDAAPKNEARREAKKRVGERDEAARSNKLTDQFARDRAAAAAPVAAPSAAAERAQGRLGAAQAFAETTEIASPDPLVRWRIRFAQLERTSDAGKTWAPVATGVTSELTTGAATSTAVCWIVGRAGVVLLTTDGHTWRRLPFPEATDLSAVKATDGRTATVTTVDGRQFATTDGGATWIRKNEVGTLFLPPYL